MVMALHSYRSGTAQIHLNRCKVVLKEQTHKTHVYELANSVTVVLSLKFHFPRSLNTTWITNLKSKDRYAFSPKQSFKKFNLWNKFSSFISAGEVDPVGADAVRCSDNPFPGDDYHHNPPQSSSSSLTSSSYQ